MTTRSYRILIVDDHPIVRHGLSELIARQSDMEVCGEAADAAEALQIVQSKRPHAAIVDITLEDSNGLELIDRIKSHHPEVKILVSSMHDETLFAERALRAGAMGYISKHESIRKVIDALRQVLSGEVYFSPHAIMHLIHHPAAGESPQHDAVTSLSNRELEVFELTGRGLTNQEIAHKLHLSPRTIDTHRRHIRTKLHLENTTQLNRYAYHWVESGQ